MLNLSRQPFALEQTCCLQGFYQSKDYLQRKFKKVLDLSVKRTNENHYRCNQTASNPPCPEASIVGYIYAGLNLEDQAQSLPGVSADNPTKQSQVNMRDCRIRSCVCRH